MGSLNTSISAYYLSIRGNTVKNRNLYELMPFNINTLRRAERAYITSMETFDCCFFYVVANVLYFVCRPRFSFQLNR